jgi:hypothetical protein
VREDVEASSTDVWFGVGERSDGERRFAQIILMEIDDGHGRHYPLLPTCAL